MRLERSNNTDPVGGLNRAKAELHDLETKVRRSMSVVAKRISSTFHHDDGEELPASKERQGIVSINGQDVETMRCCGGKRTR